MKKLMILLLLSCGYTALYSQDSMKFNRNGNNSQPTVYLVGSIHNMHLDEKNHYSINDLLAQIRALKPDLVCGEITPEAYNQPMEGYFPPEAAFLAEMADELNYRFVPVDWRLDYSTQTLAGKEIPSAVNEQSAALVKSIQAKLKASNRQSFYDILHNEVTISDLDSLYEKIIGMNALAEISSGSWHERNRRAVENGMAAAGNAQTIVFVFGVDHLPQLKRQLKSQGIDAIIPERLFTPGNDNKVSLAVLKRWQRNLNNLELIRDKKIPITYDNYQKVINSKRIEDLQAMIRQNAQDNIAFRIPEKDLIPEGITYSSINNSFYVSSIYKTKIIQINAATGAFKDFIPSDLLEMRYLGMAIDETRNLLWACGNMTKNKVSYSTVTKFDLTTGQLLKSLSYKDSVANTYNDIVLDKDGNSYFTDSHGKCVYKIDAESDSINIFYDGTEITHPNGITISPDHKYLYIASTDQGIRVLDIQKREIIGRADSTFNSKGIDGLKYYKNSLIGIQNAVDEKSQVKIVRYFLDESGTKIIDMEIIDRNNLLFDIPTTFVIVADDLYCLANSQLKNLSSPDFKIIDPDALKDVLILKYGLKTLVGQPLVKEYATKESLVNDANQLIRQFCEFSQRNGIELPYTPGVEVATTYKLIYCDPENKRIVLPYWQELYPEQRTLFTRWNGDEAQQFYTTMFNWYFIAHELGHFVLFTNPELQISTYETEHRANMFAISFFRSPYENKDKLRLMENSLQEVLNRLPVIDFQNMTEEDYFNANYQTLGNNPDAYAYFQFKFILDILKDQKEYKIADLVEKSSL